MLCREYADFRVGSDGELQGVGLLIAADPSSGRLVVLTPIKGSPADRAGILPGDEVCLVAALLACHRCSADACAAAALGPAGYAVQPYPCALSGTKQLLGAAMMRAAERGPSCCSLHTAWLNPCPPAPASVNPTSPGA